MEQRKVERLSTKRKADSQDDQNFQSGNSDTSDQSQIDGSSSFSEHIGNYIIYIHESPYGFRHSKYAAEYRREWKARSSSEEEQGLAFEKNVATIKLVFNPLWDKEEELVKETIDTSEIYDGIQRGKKKLKEEAVYVTLPSLTRFEAPSDSTKKNRGNSSDAGYHSEPQLGKALIFGHNKRLISADDKKGYDTWELEYNQITENGLYLIKWVYTEREPCFGNLYKNPCQNYLERLAQVQFNKWGFPIEVYYTNAYIKNEYNKQYKAEKINQSQVTNSKDYPLSSEPDFHQKRHEELQKDISLGKSVLYTPTIGEDDIGELHKKAQALVKELEDQLNDAKIEWKETFLKRLLLDPYLQGILKNHRINIEDINFENRGSIYDIDGSISALQFNLDGTSMDKKVNDIQNQLLNITGGRNNVSRINKNRKRLMDILQEEKLYEAIIGLKGLEKEIKFLVTQAIKEEVKEEYLTHVVRDNGVLEFVEKAQQLLSQINNTICEYRQRKKIGEEFPIENKYEEYKEIFECIKLKETIQNEVDVNNSNVDNSNLSDTKNNDKNNSPSLT